ncbi:ribosome-binding protein 1-like isoform X2 [Anneissia japonica]|uniref:ribosome-binding protein 1-like isoform X2 n=1 Tax=Anneissia japonica TaxID=1529436 RepID=UPI00142576CA|nr:ribosome-binding protein 1-like isoform X2 [Anneissia japonica]
MDDIAGKLVAMDVYEPQMFALMVFGGFVVISSLVYLVSAFGTKEKSYEEAIAEQRAHLENEKHSKPDSKSKKKPFNTRKKKKPEIVQEAQLITPAPVVIPVDIPVPQVKAQKAPKQSPKPKAESDTKHKKEAKTSEEKTTPKPSKKEVKKQPVVEAKKQPVVEAKKQPVVEEVIQKAAQKASFTAPPPSPPPKKVVEETIKAAQSEPVKSEPPKLKTKSKKETTVVASGSVKDLVADIKAARLNDKEIQQLIDTLLKQSGQGNADQWTMANQRSDPVSSLKRQLQEKEQMLHNETLSTQASAQKVKEIRMELAQEKQHSLKVDADYKNKISSLEKDIQALHLRMSQTHEQHGKESTAFQMKVKQLQALVDESNSGVIQQLREENNMLKTEANRNVAKKEQLMGNELARLQAENNKLQTQLSGSKDHGHKVDELRHGYESRIGQLEQQLQQVQVTQNEKENMLSKRLEEMGSELRTSEEQNVSLARDLEVAKNAAKMSATEAGQVKQQFQELQKSSSGGSEALSSLEAKLKAVHREKADLDARLGNVQAHFAQEEHKFTEKLKELKDANAQNDELKAKLKSSQDQLSNGEKMTMEKDKQIQDLKNQISSLGNQVTDLKNTLASKTEKDSAINGQVQETESLLKEKETLISELQEKVNSSQSDLGKLKADIEKQKKKNDALREKNWKAMEAISAAEKVSEEKVSQALKGVKLAGAVTTEQASARNTLKTLFPEINVDSSLGHSEWIAAFELQAKDHLSKPVVVDQSETVDKLNSQIATAEEEKTQLASQCQHYKKVLADTEKILNQLQASVQSEESKWHGKLTVAETELKQTKTELASLTEEIESAQELRLQADKTEKLNQNLLSELKSSQEIIQQLSQEIISVSNANDSTNKVLEVVQSQLNQVQSDIDTANKESIDKLSAEVADLKTKLEIEQEKNRKMSEDLSKAAESAAVPNDQLAGDLSRAKEAEAAAKKSLGEVTAELELARKVADESAKGVEQLKKDLEAAKHALETANEQKSNPGDDLDVLTKELEETKAALQKEKNMTKELGTAAAKLQNMLKKNQGLLTAERDITKDLKAKLGQMDVTPRMVKKNPRQQMSQDLQCRAYSPIRKSQKKQKKNTMNKLLINVKMVMNR